MSTFNFPIVGMVFYDHAMSDAEREMPFECSAIGWLYKEDALYYHIATWVCNGQVMDSDTECFHILKSCVIEKYILSPKKVKSFLPRKKHAKKS